MESFIVSWTAELDFTPEEMARLRKIDAEPFEAADPDEVEALAEVVFCRPSLLSHA